MTDEARRAERIERALADAPHPMTLISEAPDKRSQGFIAYMDWFFTVRIPALRQEDAPT